MRKRPTDPFQLAKLIGDIATGEIEDKPASSKPTKSKKKPTKRPKDK